MLISIALRKAKQMCGDKTPKRGSVGGNYLFEDSRNRIVVAREHAYSDQARVFVTNKKTGKTKEIR